ncbi:DEAD/DEAH box helicase [Gordonia zhaorongruii]|uniref:DEAD/DEAH box helicase n=1 Tax=Gordonia zhaorongruii TaxID=2597659 RepID=UPI00117EBCC7|nr:DEAD/DEAH box helicase [Gordonia zhaorongruii]
MSALLPVQSASQLRDGISEYLSTTFALADRRTQAALEKFVSDGESSMFRGPYVRTRMPFAPAGIDPLDVLNWAPAGFTPYGHQAAAFERLSTKPTTDGANTAEPTLVVTGTGSGKTEAFLLPILDHAKRERAKGHRGTKALLLYPMNALATDQAERLARMISGDPALAAVTAGIYTGDYSDGGRATVSADGIITDRRTMQDDPPDLLITNYKMLDQLLLREKDADIWKLSADSLQYVVLDEFHTYDGAQGTDVALLLRRLGMTLARHRGDSGSDTATAYPLGDITPVATSATLGDDGDTSAVREFAETVFGRPFGPDSVITESRETVERWAGPARRWISDFAGIRNIRLAVERAREDAGEHADPAEAIYRVVCDQVLGLGNGSHDVRRAADAARENELVQEIYSCTAQALSLHDLAERVLPVEFASDASETEAFVGSVLGALGHIRAAITADDPWAGRQIPSIEAHLWVRELSRIDRSVTTGGIEFRWHDDGPAGLGVSDEAEHPDFAAQHLPAIFCRNCGRAGWMTAYEPGTTRPEFAPAKIRQLSINDKSAVRALISADQEVQSARENEIPLSETRSADSSSTALRWLDSMAESFSEADAVDLLDVPEGTVPVLMHSGLDAKKNAENQSCPACDSRDSIRYIGSAVATLLSVALSNMFGTTGLDADDKKALVFADSVQDASHRAGFVQARSHSFSLRTAVTSVLGDDELALDDLADGLRSAAFSPVERYHLLHPSIADRDTFRPFWDPKATTKARNAAVRRVDDRLRFDMCLEFGLRSALGRTLALTGTAVASVSVGDADLAQIARDAWESTSVEGALSESDADANTLAAWARVVLERIRQRGGILHPWLTSYVEDDGNTYHLWNSRVKSKGIPGFPIGGAPAFPRVGPALPDTRFIRGTDAVASRRSWYARWTSQHLLVTTDSAQRLVKALLERLASADVLIAVPTRSGGVSYGLDIGQVIALAETDPGELRCATCHSATPVPRTVRESLLGVPCLNVDCGGRLEPKPIADNYYRSLYQASDSRAVVSREHTSLLDTKVRAELERQFKTSSDQPGAPNVLVATPTLEMGIDIGDLSSVMLSSLPRTVASYVQRVGRAGRLTGNSLVVALLQGRGQTLPTVQDPLSMINGSVRPPAAFLSAAEILRRQFIAHTVGSAMLDGTLPEVRTARDVFASHQNSLINVLRTEAQTHNAHWLDEFLTTLDGQVSPHAAADLREWALGTSTEQTFDSALALASDRWRAEREQIIHRLDALDAVLPALKERVDSAAATEQDTESYRSAVSARKTLAIRSAELANDPWISALERYGLLPSYRLLDDNVALEASIQAQDPDKNFEWDTTKKTIERGLSSALTEFAPGNSFYVDRMRIKIDSVDLGAGGEGIEQWRVCAACSHAETVVSDGSTSAAACPSCKDASFADMSQLIDVVPLRKVSADVKRDVDTIDERDDQRHSRRYSIAHTMSYQDQDVAARWYVRESGFGALYLRRTEIRWINLGYGQGSSATIGGEKFTAPLFRLCEYCGHRDIGGVGTNTRGDHRPWCPHAAGDSEHNRALALGRTLRTEGVVLNLPSGISGFDSMTVPSLSAALKLGFRAVLGGDPDHLDVATVNVAQPSGVAPALLLHDTIPGGTGYLADFATPERVWALLHAAWEAVRACPCAGEDRLACPRCLLPHTSPGMFDSTSREVAEGVLYRLLGGTGSDDADSPAFSAWSITSAPPVDVESNLEALFRTRFSNLLTSAGATVTTVPNGLYSKLRIYLPQTDVQWDLEAQVDINDGAVKTRPDFVLRRTDGGPRKFAIYTDGFAYHATPEHNRVADDALKRSGLRDHGWIPWAITYADVTSTNGAADAPEKASWFTKRAALAIAKHEGVAFDLVEAAAGNHVNLLVQLIQQEPKTLNLAASAARRVGNAVTTLLYATGLDTDGKRTLDHGWARFHVAGDFRKAGTLTAALRIDSSATAVESSSYRTDWAWWLGISNVLSLREEPALTAIEAVDGLGAAGSADIAADGVVSGEAPGEPVTAAPPHAGEASPQSHPPLSEEWQEVLSDYDETADDPDDVLEAKLVRLLGEAGLPLPDLGEEFDGEPAVASWPEARIAIFLSDPSDNVHSITDQGWALFDGSAPDVLDRVSAALTQESE